VPCGPTSCSPTPRGPTPGKRCTPRPPALPEPWAQTARPGGQEFAHRDRTVKLRKYAEAGIGHYWRIEDEGGLPVVHAYELDGPTRSWAPTGIRRHDLRAPAPFAISLDQDSLVPSRSN